MSGTFDAQMARGTSGANLQAAFRQDVDRMALRLDGPRQQPAHVIADAQLLAARYRALVPYARTFGPSDYALNRVIARQSLDWLGRARGYYWRDPLVAAAFLTSYDAIGGFYCGAGSFYRPGAFVAYAGAARLAQRYVLYGLDATRYELELDRFALAYGNYAVLQHALVTPWVSPRDLPDTSASPQMTDLKPVELPAIDVTQLSSEQKAAYTEARERFRSVAPRVHQARVLLSGLSSRLEQRGMSLNPTDAANALKMQGFLEDAADLIHEGQFDMAVEAIARADYVRAKLAAVTGQ